MKKILSIAILMIAIASPAAAQSPSPSPELAVTDMCVTVSAPIGQTFVAGDEIVESGDGSIHIYVVDCDPETSPEPELESSLDLYLEFLARGVDAEKDYNAKSARVSDSIDDGKYSQAATRATSLANSLKKEVAWLDAHQPDECYADAWQTYRDAWSMYRKAYVDFAYGAKHISSPRLGRAVTELNEANDLYDEIDLDSTTCVS